MNPQVAPEKNDARRIRGRPLRKSLFLIIFGWAFGACCLNAIGGASQTQLFKYFGANDRLFSYLAAMPYLATMMQLPGTLIIEKLRRRQGIFLATGISARSIYFLIGLLPWFLPAHLRTSALLMLALLFASSGLAAIGSQAWVSWMSDLVPEQVRGKFFAKRARVGIMVTAATALAVGSLMDSAGTGRLDRLLAGAARLAGSRAVDLLTKIPALIVVISLIYLLAAALGLVDILAFRKVAEAPPPPAPHASALAALRVPLHDSQFRWYVAYVSLWTFSVAFAGAFGWLFILQLLTRSGPTATVPWFARYPNFAVSLMLLVAVSVGQFVAYPIWGRLIDKLGTKPIILICSNLFTIPVLSWGFLDAGNVCWGFLIAFASGLIWAGGEIANFNLMLHFNRKGGTGYQAFYAAFVNIAGMLGGLVAGVYMMRIHDLTFTLGNLHLYRYNMLYYLGVIGKCLADWFLLPRVKQTDARPTRYALRYITGALMENAIGYSRWPVRIARNAVGEAIRPFRRRG